MSQATTSTKALRPLWQCENPLCDEGFPAAKLRACQRCQRVVYCGRECQKYHWKRSHKKECAALTAEREESDGGAALGPPLYLQRAMHQLLHAQLDEAQKQTLLDALEASGKVDMAAVDKALKDKAAEDAM